MKKLLIVADVVLLMALIGCTNKSTTSFNLETEKAKINDVLDKNLDLLVKGNDALTISFYRTYNLPQYYEANKDGIKLVSQKDSTDKALLPSPSVKFISYKIDEAPVIKISSDGEMAYYLGKAEYSYQIDSSGIIIIRDIEDIILQIFEKQDSIWVMGDYMSIKKRK